MNINTIHLCYFSPTCSTQKVLQCIAKPFDVPIMEHDLTDCQATLSISFQEDDLVLFGCPVYGGRVPEIFLDRLIQVKGHHTLAIAIATYGNRAFEDALLELQQSLSPKGFQFISAGAIVCEHNIIRSIATNRPDEFDYQLISNYTQTLQHVLTQDTIPTTLTLPGNIPYKASMVNRMFPKANKTCTKCEVCAKACPMRAISPSSIATCQHELCIGCMRCIYVCPIQARHIPKPAYLMAETMLKKVANTRKEPTFYIAEKK